MFPLMCYDDEDDQLWKEDPQEYIRMKYGMSVCVVCVCVCVRACVHACVVCRMGVDVSVVCVCVDTCFC